MCLTAYYIDYDWFFFQIANHKGETMAKTLKICIKENGLKRVMTVAVDNTSSSDMVLG